MALRSGNDISWTPIQGDYGSFVSSFGSVANNAMTNATNAIGKLQEAAQKRRDQDITALNNAATYQLGLEKQNLAERTLQSELDAIKEANNKWQTERNANIAANRALYEPTLTMLRSSGSDGIKLADNIEAKFKALEGDPEAQAKYIASIVPFGVQSLTDKQNFDRTVYKMNFGTSLQRLIGGDTFGYNLSLALLEKGLQNGTITWDGKNLHYNNNPNPSNNASVFDDGALELNSTKGQQDYITNNQQ